MSMFSDCGLLNHHLPENPMLSSLQRHDVHAFGEVRKVNFAFVGDRFAYLFGVNDFSTQISHLDLEVTALVKLKVQIEQAL